MDTIYTYVGMAVTWTLAAIAVILLLRLMYHTVYTLVKAVDFMRFHKSMSLRTNPDFKWKHNLAYTYAGAVNLMWTEDGDGTTIRHATGPTYHAFNWK